MDVELSVEVKSRRLALSWFLFRIDRSAIKVPQPGSSSHHVGSAAFIRPGLYAPFPDDPPLSGRGHIAEGDTAL